jgi:long-chain acyl-CoA synthetase
MNAAHFILDNKAEPAKEALLTARGVFTHRDIRRGTAEVAGLLQDRGFSRGSLFLLVDQSSFFWVSAYLGIIASGGVSVPLPATIEPDQFRRILEMTAARGIFMGAGAFKRYGAMIPQEMTVFVDRQVATDQPVEILVLDNGRGKSAGWKFDPVDVDESRDMAALMFTSGSTGIPRGVMVSHRNIIANTESIIECLELTAGDRVMAFLPFHYCFGASLLHTHLRVGGSLVVENSFLFPNSILKKMVQTDCTVIAGVPSHYQILLRNSSLKKTTFPRLRCVQQAGGKLYDIFLDELRRALPTAGIYTMYGQTEATARLSFLSPELLDRKLGSIGKGIPGVRLEVLNASGQAVSPGEVGEIVAWGDSITLGYWREPEATKATFRGGALFTGDLATVDEEGFIYVVDRAKDFIKCGGNRVSCRQIEDVLLRYPGMVEAAVIPTFDEALGEAVCLCAVHPTGGSVRDDLVRYCGQNLPWDQVPRSIHFLKALPMNFSGKIDKQVLKRLYGNDGSHQQSVRGVRQKTEETS